MMIRKLGLVRYFHCVEIVADKTTEVYRTILQRYKVNTERFLMNL